MSHFTEKELAYLSSQRLGRLATINEKGQPQNSPVSFRYNPDTDTIDIAGRFMSQSKKFRNILANPKVSFVVDDVLPPWQPRGVEIRGQALALTTGGEGFFGTDYPSDPALIRILPEQIIGWGVDSDAYQPNNRKVTAKG